MRGMTVREAAQIVGGKLYGDGTEEITGVVIDSRNVKNGFMFAALKGEKTDGHKYIAKAFELGAVCCIAQYVSEGICGDMIVVENVESALRTLAEAYRKRFDIPIIGISGSVGKTTAKEMTASVLSQRFNVLKTEKNLNNELGVPLTIFRIEPEHQIAVIEMGISDFGEMSRLAQMVRPTMAIYTLIGHAHLECLLDRPGVLKAKTEMLDYMHPDAVLFMNGDDDLLAGFVSEKRKILFGTGDNADVRAENIHYDPEMALCFTVVCGERRFDVKTPAYGQHMVYAALEGAAVGMEMGLTDDEIIKGIAEFETVGRRASVVDTGCITLIDDCYNANPDSVKCGIDSLRSASGRKVCILGDMLGMGENKAELHAGIGRYVSEKGIDMLITVGELSENTHNAASIEKKHYFTNSELIGHLPQLLRRGDTVLVKASHDMRFDEISDALKQLII